MPPPCSGWVWHLALFCSPSRCSFPSYRSRSSSVLCCRVCCGWGSVVARVEGGMMWMVCAVLLCVSCCVWCIFSVLHRTHCVCCHSIVGLVLCLCGRVVLGRRACGVYRLHIIVCGVHLRGVCIVMAVCDDSACFVLSHCAAGCGMAACEGVWSRCSSSSSSLLFVLVFGVVRAQPCEHARYPRTPLCPLFVLSLLFFLSAPRRSSCPAFLLLLEWRGGDSPCVGVLCWHDGDG